MGDSSEPDHYDLPEPGEDHRASKEDERNDEEQSDDEQNDEDFQDVSLHFIPSTGDDKTDQAKTDSAVLQKMWDEYKEDMLQRALVKSVRNPSKYPSWVQEYCELNVDNLDQVIKFRQLIRDIRNSRNSVGTATPKTKGRPKTKAKAKASSSSSRFHGTPDFMN
jgi:hypothetical protein